MADIKVGGPTAGAVQSSGDTRPTQLIQRHLDELTAAMATYDKSTARPANAWQAAAKSFSTGPSAGEALTALERKLDQIAPNRKRTDDNYSPTRGDIGPNASINVRAQADLVKLELLGTLADRQKSLIQNMR